jgi:hypothetical protein
MRVLFASPTFRPQITLVSEIEVIGNSIENNGNGTEVDGNSRHIVVDNG